MPGGADLIASWCLGAVVTSEGRKGEEAGDEGDIKALHDEGEGEQSRPSDGLSVQPQCLGDGHPMLCFGSGSGLVGQTLDARNAGSESVPNLVAGTARQDRRQQRRAIAVDAGNAGGGAGPADGGQLGWLYELGILWINVQVGGDGSKMQVLRGMMVLVHGGAEAGSRSGSG